MMTESAMTEIAQSTDKLIDGQPAATGRAFRPRRLLRFSLRTMLIVTALLGVWLGVHLRRADRQRDAVAAIREYGGWVWYDFHMPPGSSDIFESDRRRESPWPQWLIDYVGIDFFHDVVQVELDNLYYSNEDGLYSHANENTTDEALQYLPAFRELRVLRLSGTQASDESMRHLASLTKLDKLVMTHVDHVGDDGVAHLKNLRRLRYVQIFSAKLTDKSLILLSELPRMETLDLSRNRFTDEGVAHASRSRTIHELQINGRLFYPSPITDASLERLAKMPNLNTLGLYSTKVTEAGVARFRSERPDCRVTHSRFRP